ncbi:hypothetical protein ACOV11_04485 [Vibrio natriegens]
MINFERDNAFSIEIKDPDNPDSCEAILNTLVLEDSLYLFKTNSIFRMLTADSIDPNRTELTTKHSYEKIMDIGCSSDYVARVLMQAEKLAPYMCNSDIDKERILSLVWAMNRLLLNCRKVVSDLEWHYKELVPKCNQIILDNQNSNVLPALPKVPELESKVRVFLTNAKLVLIDIFKFLSLFYSIPINDRNESHFNKHIDFLRDRLGSNNEIVKLLIQDLDWIRLLSELRNAIEHSGAGQYVEIENFSIKPGNRYSPPSWTYDLTKKLKVKKGPYDLLNELDVLCSNMMHLIEDLIVLVTLEKLEDHQIITLYKLDEQSIKTECPVRYDVTLKTNLVS